jgi:serine protease inhibitor
VAAAAWGCTGDTPQAPAACQVPHADSVAQSLVAANTSFAVDFYRPAVGAVGAGQNAVLSPYSASATLTMVDVGAAGETATQLRTTLHLPDSGTNIAPAFAAVACQDATDGSSAGNQLLIANSLWGQKGKTFQAQFLSVLSGGYGAPLQQVDFSGNPGASASSINQWVSKETNAKIPALLQPGDVTSATALVLVDAIYFDGVWDVGFDPNDTSPRPFTLSDGTLASVPTMSGTVNLGMGSAMLASQPLSVYELPYKGRSLAMDFLLPSGSLSDLEASLTSDALVGALAAVGTPSQASLQLPKFAFSTRLGLNPVLAGMGMPDLFDPTKADLSGIDGQKDLYVSAVVQEALIEVDEQGTVAAAATASGVGGLVVIEPQSVAIDHPFLFLIRDTTNGSILFVGRVEDPRQG